MAMSNVKRLGALPSPYTLQVQLALNIKSVNCPIHDQVCSSGPSILPADTYDHVITLFWTSYIDQKFFPPLEVIGATQDEEARTVAIEHLTGDRTLFTTFKECLVGTVTFGDGNDSTVSGKCKIKFSRIGELKNILYVKGLATNLLDISQIYDEEFQILY
ncbi:glutathione S-transferase U17-like [Cornus florida]|uniref:glutathione S-transferase U17-like n=1 Tax=Cornus florida TaxID=4283 RepID=UPI00289E6618|nr:glutathione S-transferase U17-like [Cornus florida]